MAVALSLSLALTACSGGNGRKTGTSAASSSRNTSSQASASSASSGTSPATSGSDSQSSPSTAAQGSITYSPVTVNQNKVVPILSVGQRNKMRAAQLYGQILTDFWSAQGLYTTNYTPERNDQPMVASVWGYSSLLELSGYICNLFPGDSQKTSTMASIFKGMDYYREARSDHLVYGVNRSPVPGTASMATANDDQMWIEVDYLYNYKLTHDKEYLDKAEKLVAYDLSYWDKSINPATGKEFGGIWWAPGGTTKNTCSNGPIVVPLIELYQITKDKSYLTWAEKIYDFARNTFLTSDNLYGDLIGCTVVAGKTTAQGTVDHSYYTYNTGSMISAGVALYQATGNKEYLNEAIVSARASYDYFTQKNIKSGYIQFVPPKIAPASDTLWFNSVLYKSYLALYPYNKTEVAGYFSGIQKGIDYAYDHYYNNGYLPTNWLVGWVWGYSEDNNKNILDVNAQAETYAILADYELNVKNK